MKKGKDKGLDFIIDKLTNSIENVVSGDSFQTEISILNLEDIKTISRKNGWVFDWKLEFRNPIKEVYKLTIIGNPNIIQGLVCIEVKSDHIFMHLIESAPFNKGKKKSTMAYLEIWSHLLVNFRFREDFKELFPFSQNHN